MSDRRRRKRSILANGLKRRCPRCGDGRLFHRWLRLRDACPACGLRYLVNQGDPWAFLLVVDRAFLLVLVAIIYFKLWPKSLPALLVLFATVIAAFVATMPHRYGLCVALDYWTRTRWGDPSDEARRAAEREPGTREGSPTHPSPGHEAAPGKKKAGARGSGRGRR